MVRLLRFESDLNSQGEIREYFQNKVSSNICFDL